MRILLVGGGGREHALAWTLAGSPLCDKLFCAPGNAGIAGDAECVAIGSDESERLVAFGREQKIDLAVVGPEAPLVAGLVDRLGAAGIKAFGPSAAAARLEASKGFTKDLCRRFGIPTAGYRRFTELEPAKHYIRELAATSGGRLVVKADGLAAGKGVTIAESAEAAEAAAEAALAGQAFGAAGAEIVIEEFLEGEEVSFFALVDGRHALPLASAQDHKRAFDGDQGPNTGGMGAYSPARLMTPELQARIMAEIIEPTVAGMAELGAPFKGVLYAGLMVSDGAPKLIEYNVRFGDPECQVLMMRLMSDLIPALLASIDGELKDFDLRWYPEAALTVVMAARGYPGRYKSGEAIEGLDAALEVEDVEIFHAGTKAGPNGEVLSNGGRVLSVTALGETLAEARDRAYRAVDLIDWPGGFCRHDIGWRALEDGKR